MLVALELDHRIDDVLENLRACQRSLLRDVADEDDGHAAGLGKAEQRRGTFADLCDGTCGRLDILRHHRLDGVDDHQFRLHVLDMLKDVL